MLVTLYKTEQPFNSSPSIKSLRRTVESAVFITSMKKSKNNDEKPNENALKGWGNFTSPGPDS